MVVKISGRMTVIKSICLSIPVLFGFLHGCAAIGIRRVGYESKYGRVIHEETAGCGSLHEVGPGEKFYFNSKLIRSPFDSSSRRDIHYIDFSKNKKTDSVSSKLEDSFPNNEEFSNPATDTPQSPSDVDGDSGSLASNSRTAVSPSNYKKISLQNSKNLGRKNGGDHKWRSDLSPPIVSGGVKYNSLGKEVEEVATTVAAPVSTRKPHWSDRYYGKSIKESTLFDMGQERSIGRLQAPRVSSPLTRDRRGFFSNHAHQPSAGNSRKLSKRSIFSSPKKSMELQKGRHETCTWRFTAKATCKHLTARLTRFKANEIQCDKEYLLFKGHFDQFRVCNDNKFSGGFHAKGKTLIVEHKKILGGPESNFEGYVACLDK